MPVDPPARAARKVTLETLVFNTTANTGHDVVANVAVDVAQNGTGVAHHTGRVYPGSALDYFDKIPNDSPILVHATYRAAVGGAILARCTATVHIAGATPGIDILLNYVEAGGASGYACVIQ